ncbi:hypothetical protein ACFQ2B_40055 [Streptomyces stramineus]
MRLMRQAVAQSAALHGAEPFPSMDRVLPGITRPTATLIETTWLRTATHLIEHHVPADRRPLLGAQRAKANA